MQTSLALLVVAVGACSGACGLAASRTRPAVPLVASIVAVETPHGLAARRAGDHVTLIADARPEVQRAGADGLDRMFAMRPQPGARPRAVADIVGLGAGVGGPLGCVSVQGADRALLPARLL